MIQESAIDQLQLPVIWPNAAFKASHVCRTNFVKLLMPAVILQTKPNYAHMVVEIVPKVVVRVEMYIAEQAQTPNQYDRTGASFLHGARKRDPVPPGIRDASVLETFLFELYTNPKRDWQDVFNDVVPQVSAASSSSSWLSTFPKPDILIEDGACNDDLFNPDAGNSKPAPKSVKRRKLNISSVQSQSADSLIHSVPTVEIPNRVPVIEPFNVSSHRGGGQSLIQSAKSSSPSPETTLQRVESSVAPMKPFTHPIRTIAANQAKPSNPAPPKPLPFRNTSHQSASSSIHTLPQSLKQAIHVKSVTPHAIPTVLPQSVRKQTLVVEIPQSKNLANPLAFLNSTNKLKLASSPVVINTTPLTWGIARYFIEPSVRLAMPKNAFPTMRKVRLGQSSGHNAFTKLREVTHQFPVAASNGTLRSVDLDLFALNQAFSFTCSPVIHPDPVHRPVPVVAIDCLLTITHRGIEPKHVVLVDYAGNVLYDQNQVPIVQARNNLYKYIDQSTIVIGHRLDLVLCALRIIHPTVIDTVQLFNSTSGGSLNHVYTSVLRKPMSKTNPRDLLGNTRAMIELVCSKIANPKL